jgi:WD40 repeat protein
MGLQIRGCACGASGPPILCAKIESDDAGDAWSACWSPSGALLAVGHDDGKVLIYEMGDAPATSDTDPTAADEDDGVPSAAPAHAATILEDFGMESVHCCCFGREALLATGGWEGELRLWEASPAEDAAGAATVWACIATLAGHDGCLRSVDFSPNHRLVATASADSTVRVWRVAQHQCTATLSGHTLAVNSVAFAPTTPDQPTRLGE